MLGRERTLILGREEDKAWCWEGEKILLLGRGDDFDAGEGRK